MFPDVQRYMEMKYGSKKPQVEVTEEEFVVAMVATGVTEEKAKSAAFFAKQMGSFVEIDGKLLGIKQEIKVKQRKFVKLGESLDYQIEQQDVNHKRICIGGEMMTFIKASQLIRQTKNLGVTEAMDYVDNLPWLES